ncbi:MAG: Uma2 family endonuclease [Acidobacteriaceae bacterium]|nr:Uma2 family endonuclease [Acidobacteriaceae bacterium]
MAAAFEVTSRLFESGRTLIIRPAEDEDANALFEHLCEEFGEPNRIEQDSDGNIYIMPPPGGEASHQNADVLAQLQLWSKTDKRGVAFDSSVMFVLPNRAKRSPDGSWVSLQRLKALPREERRQFLKLVPEFVIEIKPPSDRWPELQNKMLEYRDNGVLLGWLIHPEKQIVLVYRYGCEDVEVVRGSQIVGEGPVSGFVLDLEAVWKGLDF